jgi:hypothetical protein
MSKDYKTVTSFELCPDLGFDSYISPALKEQHSEFANQCTGRQRIEATWPKWKGHLRVNVCSTCQERWSMVILKFQHPRDVWKCAVTASRKVGETCRFSFFLHEDLYSTHSWIMYCQTLWKKPPICKWPQICLAYFFNFSEKQMNFANFIEPGISMNFLHSRFYFWGVDQLCAVQRQRIQAKDAMGYGSKLPSSEIDVRLAENGSKYVEIIFNLDNYTGNPQV